MAALIEPNLILSGRWYSQFDVTVRNVFLTVIHSSEFHHLTSDARVCSIAADYEVCRLLNVTIHRPEGHNTDNRRSITV